MKRLLFGILCGQCDRLCRVVGGEFMGIWFGSGSKLQFYSQVQ